MSTWNREATATPTSTGHSVDSVVIVSPLKPPKWSAQPISLARLADYLELTKPKIAVLALATVTFGYVLASGTTIDRAGLMHALIGITLVAVSSSVLNQLIERDTDRRMDRTRNRPMVTGRVTAIEGLVFGLATGMMGTLYLSVFVNLQTAILGVFTLLTYVALYTPMKRTSSFCTTIGAVPGALPPVLGWSAAGGSLDAGAAALFAILFFWQFPHFLAIGWLYRTQYERAGLKMLPSCWANRNLTGALAVLYALALLPVSLLPSVFDMAGSAYFAGAIVLGMGYLICAVLFMANETRSSARRLLWSSLLYLPLLLTILTWDHFQLLR
ncbi:heme o synthase [Thalassoroseus pseudoceratinae]|uniref:heme o synthase n=1 Tax=Thalassoroseus pseudoceratinae TaxID=2713176 RepID=UPI001F0D53AE|nr:heme o synthase [Thalassoroseus pseudoceratinae]